MLTDDTIRQIFFYCENNDPEGTYADGVDIIEFARRIEAVVSPLIKRDEHLRCVEIVNNLNREVAATLACKTP